MEGTIKLNMGNKADCSIALGKATKMCEGESAKKTFGNLINKFIGDKGEASGSFSELLEGLNSEIPKMPLTDDILQKGVAEENSKDSLVADLEGLLGVMALEKPARQDANAGIEGCGENAPTDNPAALHAEAETDGLDLFTVFHEMTKTVPDGAEASKNAEAILERRYAVDFAAPSEVKEGATAFSGKRSGATSAVADWKPADLPGGSEDVLIAEAEDTLYKEEIRKTVSKQKAPESGRNFFSNDVMGKEIAVPDKGGKNALGDAEATGSGDGMLHSAREQSLLNRLSGMRPVNDAGKGVSASEGPKGAPEGEQSGTVLEMEKAAPVKDGEAGAFEKRDAESRNEDFGGKISGAVEAGARKSAGSEIAGTEVSRSPGAIENLEEIGAKIEFGMDRVRENGKSVVRVRLRPEELGRMEIRLTQENGVVKGRILVESESVREQLNQLLLEDKSMHAFEGFKAKEVEVSVFGQQTGGFRDFGQGAFNFRRGPGGGGVQELMGEKSDKTWQNFENGTEIQRGLDLFA